MSGGGLVGVWRGSGGVWVIPLGIRTGPQALVVAADPDAPKVCVTLFRPPRRREMDRRSPPRISRDAVNICTDFGPDSKGFQGGFICDSKKTPGGFKQNRKGNQCGFKRGSGRITDNLGRAYKDGRSAWNNTQEN